MVNSIVLVGRIGELKDGSICLIHRRSYKNQQGAFELDYFKLRYWTKNVSNPLFKVNKDSLITIQGKLESDGDQTYIIVNEYSLLKEEH